MFPTASTDITQRQSFRSPLKRILTSLLPFSCFHQAPPPSPPPAPALLQGVVKLRREDVLLSRKIGEGAFGEVSQAHVFPYGVVAIKWLKVGCGRRFVIMCGPQAVTLQACRVAWVSAIAWCLGSRVRKSERMNHMWGGFNRTLPPLD